ncbi:hypothetical protein ASE86_14695 [Sphingomonas sp. Leaf33]|uniref:hypothetical protein n=1 Tax=Sphingomonas sp. Leaf33 TaxID=1736215 RepID=UPI0006F8763B|nr:hypothetical protein [Sphingomonas sp. Leaf33]KQN21220.1 hypothetical protein ASE86_14695 [Sphingomonas sp. Leaf33]
MKTMAWTLLFCLPGAAHGQTAAPNSTPSVPGPVVPGPVVPAPGADDPVARAMAQQALTLAADPTIAKVTVVGGPLGAPFIVDTSGTIGNTPFQVNGNQPGNTGYTAFKYGADGKGVTNYWVKSRSPTPNGFAAVQLGDRIVADYWQAGTGAQSGHVGAIQVTVDNAAFTAGEVAGRWSLSTGTGVHNTQAGPQYPNRWGSMEAIVANSYQQVMFPGGVVDATPQAGGNFGGWVVIGAGAASPGFGPLKFLSAGAALLTRPEPGAFEVDAAARPYFTSGDGVRRRIVLADTTAPTVQALESAGTGATAQIDGVGTSGVVTLTTGAGTASGGLFTVTYPQPYPTASYPVVSAANPAAVTLVRGGYLTATAGGFTLSLPPGGTVPAGTSFAITFAAPGR